MHRHTIRMITNNQASKKRRRLNQIKQRRKDRKNWISYKTLLETSGETAKIDLGNEIGIYHGIHWEAVAWKPRTARRRGQVYWRQQRELQRISH